MMSKAYQLRKKKEKEKNKGKEKRKVASHGGPNFTPKQDKSLNPGHPQAMKELRCLVLHNLYGKK